MTLVSLQITYKDNFKSQMRTKGPERQFANLLLQVSYASSRSAFHSKKKNPVKYSTEREGV
jgi:hypothetical protein